MELDDGVVPMDVCVSNEKGAVRGREWKGGYGSMGEMTSTNSNNSKLNNTTQQQQQQYIAVSSLQYIYILDSKTLDILGNKSQIIN